MIFSVTSYMIHATRFRFDKILEAVSMWSANRNARAVAMARSEPEHSPSDQERKRVRKGRAVERVPCSLR